MSFQQILEVAIPSITIFLMSLVGMDVTIQDFRKVLVNSKPFWIGTIGQWLLPFCGWGVITLLSPVPAIAAGMILIASAPAGGISTYYSLMAGVNVALSIVLTTVSSVAAAITMPVFLRFFDSFLPLANAYDVPLKALFGHLLYMLVIPVLVGLGIRFRCPELVSRYGKTFKQIGFVALGSLIFFILYQTRGLFFSNWLEITKAATLFILVSMILGWATGRLFQIGTVDSFTLSIEYGTRNVGITTAMAVVVLQRTDFATFAAFYFLLEAVLILPIIAIYRKWIDSKTKVKKRSPAPL